MHFVYPFLVIRGYPGSNDNSQKGPLFLELIRSFTHAFTIQFGHHDVCDDRIGLEALDRVKTLFPISGRDHLVALILQFEFDHTPYMGFIVYDENLLIVS